MMETKKVRFAPEVIIYHQSDWPDEVYTEARKGQWHHFALDRRRFQKRILKIDKVIRYCLSHDHRAKIHASTNSSAGDVS